MSVPRRVDELFEDSQQVLRIAQEVIQAASFQAEEEIQKRDREIARLRERVRQLERQLFDTISSGHAVQGEYEHAQGLTSTSPS